MEQRGAVIDKPAADPVTIKSPWIVEWFRALSQSAAGKELCDLKIGFGGKSGGEIPVHKAILAATVPFFEDMTPFLEDASDGGNNSSVELDPEIVSPESFQMIWNFINGSQIHEAALKKEEVTRACEFLMFDAMKLLIEAGRPAAEPYIGLNVRGCDTSRLWGRNFANLLGQGSFCDLTVKFYGAGLSEQPSFRVHKCLLVGAFSKLPKLYPNLRELSEVELCASHIQPAMFQRLVSQVYGTEELGDIDDMYELFELIQACDFLGFDSVLEQCFHQELGAPVDEEADEMRYHELDWCFELNRYARSLKRSLGWAYPADVLCRNFTLCTFISGQEGCRSPYSFPAARFVALKTMPVEELMDLLRWFRPYSLIQRELLTLLVAWYLKKPQERSKHVKELVSWIHMEVFDIDDFDWLRGDVKKVPWVRNLAARRPPRWRKALASRGLDVSVAEMRLQNRFVSQLTGLDTCAVIVQSSSIAGFSSSGHLLFETRQHFKSRSQQFLNMVSFSGRVFLIFKSIGDLLHVWELRGDGGISKRFRLQWLLPTPANAENLHIVVDQKLLHVVECTRGKENFDLQGCSYDLCSLDMTKFSDHLDAHGELAPFLYSFQNQEFDIPAFFRGSSRYLYRKPPKPIVSATGDALLFLMPATTDVCPGPKMTIDYDVHTYDVKRGVWGKLPPLPCVDDYEELYIVCTSYDGCIYAGFRVSLPLYDDVSVVNIMKNGPKCDIQCLEPNSDRWTCLDSAPGLLVGCPLRPQLFSVGHRLFVTGWERWGGVRVTKSLDLPCKATGWQTHPELECYEHPDYFCSIQKAPGGWTDTDAAEADRSPGSSKTDREGSTSRN